MKMRSRKGFTLIELIVVIAVLALLAVIAVPTVSSMVSEAKEAEAAANARTIELAVKAYIADGNTIANQGDIDDALELYGIDNPITGSSAGYIVDSDGEVEIDNSPTTDGAITFE